MVYRQWSLLEYDGNQGMFLILSGGKDDFSNHHGKKAKCTPVGKGTIVFQTEMGEWFRVTNVLHVPGMGMNLLSVSQLQGKGYDIFFIKEKVYVKTPALEKESAD